MIFVMPGRDRCDNGLVMWLPLEWPVTPAGNGLVVAKQSHAEHLQMVQNGTWSRLGSGVQAQLEILDLYRRLGETSDHFSPSLAVGDVLIFSKCSVHTSSGDNSARARVEHSHWSRF